MTPKGKKKIISIDEQFLHLLPIICMNTCINYGIGKYNGCHLNVLDNLYRTVTVTFVMATPSYNILLK